MVKKIVAILALVFLGVLFFNLFQAYDGTDTLNTTAAYYAENGAEDVGAANLVTSVVVTYRGLDTLGEVTILFVTAAVLAFFLKGKSEQTRVVRESSELFKTAGKFLVPMIFLLGAYVFINGHLTPGGGFQGGAIMASALVLCLLVDSKRKVNKTFFTIVESISGFAYVGLGIAGIFLAGGFLDNTVLPLGEFGTLLSAGIVPVIYILIGLKVGTELSGLLSKFQESQEVE